MSNQIATTNNSTEVATADVGTWSPGQQSDFSPRERDELRAVQPGLEKASDADLHKLFAVCKQADLNPYLKEVYLVGRWSKQGTVWATQTSIDGFRKATHRYAESKSLPVTISAPIFYDEQGNKRPFWSKKFGDHPEAAEVTVSVGNSSATVINGWDEYVQTLKDGTTNSMWKKMGATMLAKTAEAGAHRRVCPLTAGLYVDEEMQQASNPVSATATVQRQEEPNGDNRQSIEAAVVEHDGWTVDEVVSIIRSATNADELGQQKEFVGQFVAEHPDARDQINDAWTEKAKEFA